MGMEHDHEGLRGDADAFRRKLQRASEDFRERARREMSTEVFRERERDVEYQKDCKAEHFAVPAGSHESWPDFFEPPIKKRVDEITKTVHRVTTEEPLDQACGKVPESPKQSGANKWLIAVSACAAAVAICAAGLSAHYRHALVLERIRLLERAGSHELCREERAALQASLASAESARLAAEREAGAQAGNAMRLHAELAESKAEARRARAAAAAAIHALEALEAIAATESPTTVPETTNTY